MIDSLSLQDYAARRGIDIDWYPLHECEALAVEYEVGTYAVAVNNRKYFTEARLKTNLAHEIGHCETGCLYNEKTPVVTRGKCERWANEWAIKKLMPKTAFKKAVREGNTEAWQLADYFNVEQILAEKAMEYYNEGEAK